MIQIRKTPKTTSADRTTKAGESSGTEESGAPVSPFAIKPPDPLRSLTERKSRPLTEEQKLALLQRALGPFAEEAKRHLPPALRKADEDTRKEMIRKGFSKERAHEAGEEIVAAILGQKTKRD